MKGFIKNNCIFFILYFIIILLLLPVLLLIPKSTIHLFINHIHCVAADFFFKYITYLGSGLTVVAVAILYTFISWRKMFIISVSAILCGLVVQILKHLLFPEIMRPYKFFENNGPLHLIDGVKMLSNNSFPSGHATTIFSLCLCLALFARFNHVKIILFCLALTVAFSRVYLSQHFLADTYFGSILGVLITIPVYKYFYNLQAIWLDDSILGLKTK